MAGKVKTACSKCGSGDIAFGKRPNGRCRKCNAAGMRALKARRREAGSCTECGKAPRPDMKTCGDCAHRLISSGKARMTREYREATWQRQDGRCAICTESLRDIWSAHGDHDHTSGKMRGLLCPRCNRAVGFVEFRPWLLDATEAYLDRHAE